MLIVKGLADTGCGYSRATAAKGITNQAGGTPPCAQSRLVLLTLACETPLVTAEDARQAATQDDRPKLRETGCPLGCALCSQLVGAPATPSLPSAALCLPTIDDLPNMNGDDLPNMNEPGRHELQYPPGFAPEMYCFLWRLGRQMAG